LGKEDRAPNARHPDQDVRVIAGTPSWLLIFFERLFCAEAGTRGRGLPVFFPNLEKLIIHGGVNFAPTVSDSRRCWRAAHAEHSEVYPASEGFIAAADRGPAEGLRLISDNGLFYEFVPLGELAAANTHPPLGGEHRAGLDYAVRW